MKKRKTITRFRLRSVILDDYNNVIKVIRESPEFDKTQISISEHYKQL